MLFRIDPTRDEPLYLQLDTQVHLALARGELRTGDRLPAARELAELLDLNVHTVLHAYQRLRDKGVIDLRRGRGAVVTATAPRSFDDVRGAVKAFAVVARESGLSLEAAVTLLREEMNP